MKKHKEKSGDREAWKRVNFTQVIQEGSSMQRPNEGWSHAGVWRENIPEPEAACVKAPSWGVCSAWLASKTPWRFVAGAGNEEGKWRLSSGENHCLVMTT